MIRLKELRLERKLNMKQLATDLNIPYTTYVNYEKGEREPNSEMLIFLADYFSVSVDYLLGRSNERVDELLLDIVNEIDNDILESSGGNIHKALAEQERRNKQKQPSKLDGKSELIDAIIRELSALPEEKQQEVLRYIRFVKNE